jgi:hypothetical protein
MTQIPMNQRRWMSVTIVLGTAAAAAAGWLLGPRIGLFAGLFWIPLNILSFTLVGQIGGEVVLRRWPAVLVSLAAG